VGDGAGVGSVEWVRHNHGAGLQGGYSRCWPVRRKNQAVDLARQCRRHSVQRRRENEKNLDKSDVKMFKKFPPQAAKGW